MRIIEPAVTVFSAAELRVVSGGAQGLCTAALCFCRMSSTSAPCAPERQAVIPIGEVGEEELLRYASLITRFRQVELANVRSFYKEQQKSPFKFFPWKSGTMHFRFLPVSAIAATTRGQNE